MDTQQQIIKLKCGLRYLHYSTRDARRGACPVPNQTAVTVTTKLWCIINIIEISQVGQSSGQNVAQAAAAHGSSASRAAGLEAPVVILILGIACIPRWRWLVVPSVRWRLSVVLALSSVRVASVGCAISSLVAALSSVGWLALIILSVHVKPI